MRNCSAKVRAYSLPRGFLDRGGSRCCNTNTFSSVSTGYGQPCTLSSTLQDTNFSDDVDQSLSLPEEIDHRLKISGFCNKITSLLFSDLQSSSRSTIARSLAFELRGFEAKYTNDSSGN